MLIPFSFLKYVVAFNVVYWPVRQVAPEGVTIWIAFASWPIVWWVARRRRQRLFYERLARQRMAEEAAGELAQLETP